MEIVLHKHMPICVCFDTGSCPSKSLHFFIKSYP